MNIKQLRESGWIVLEVISGSHAYGTNIEGSDIDKKGIYIQPSQDVFANHIPQVSDEQNDTTFYEIGRFIELWAKGNPNVIEILNSPEDCIIYKHPIIDEYFPEEVKKLFITTKLRHTFSGYAHSQIKKAKGLEKLVNWDENKINRKDVLDFCYVLGNKEESIPFKVWKDSISNARIPSGPGRYLRISVDIESIGLAKVNNFVDMYSMYYLEEGGGIISEDSNDVQLRNIPKNAPHIGYLRFDKNAYSTHCKDYKRYQTWLKERNDLRYQNIKDHGQNYDGKNLLHTVRLLNTVKDIAAGKGIIVRRPPEECEYLKSIRLGKVDLEEIYNKAESTVKEIDTLFDNSGLPREVHPKFVRRLITNIRMSQLKADKLII